MCRRDRVIRHSKRELGDHHVSAIFAGQINTLKEASQAKDSGSLSRINMPPMLIQQSGFAHPILNQHMVGEYLLNLLEHRLHLSSRRKQ